MPNLPKVKCSNGNIIVLALIIGFIASIFSTFQVVHAVNVKMYIPTPEGESGNTPAETVRNLYNFSLAVVGLLAFGAVVIAAIEYSVSAGNASKQSDAKDRIKSAITGILLLVGASLIFNTINPDIAKLQNPAVQKLEARGVPHDIEQWLMSGTVHTTKRDVIVCRKVRSRTPHDEAFTRPCASCPSLPPCPQKAMSACMNEANACTSCVKLSRTGGTCLVVQ
ncbi:hypothetical protein D6779_06025 [Candidatus Parcubacteria bacterium]|nr:MAG: hypothetical protein D6779_06025 [Candidatus Parcubacteria bacterium]